jgi:nicotinamidase-related amidase
MPEPERIDRRRAALIAYDVCRRALIPSDPARRIAMRPVLEAWVQMIATARAAGVPVIYTTSKPPRWRRCRQAADRPLGGDRRAAPH